MHEGGCKGRKYKEKNTEEVRESSSEKEGKDGVKRGRRE